MASSGDLKESEDDQVDVMKITEFDPVEMEKTMAFLMIDFQQQAAEYNKKNAVIRQQLGKSYNFVMRSEAARLKSFLTYVKLSSWCPKLMASAGFYFTGVERSVQCFCCGLVFCSSSLRTPPYEDHVKRNPSCGFIQGKDVGNIPKYEVRVQVVEISHGDLQEFITEESRLVSFRNWPFYARIQSEELARAGFLFTGLKDTVRCFSCRGCLGNWEENDDPWKEHAKWFPDCSFLASKKAQSEIKQYITSYNGFSGFTGEHFMTILGDKILPTETSSKSISIFQDEDVRLDSFKRWPENSHVNPADLARAGFYYKGISDAVQCFTCGISLCSFEPDDDPYIEHMKFRSSCEFLHSMAQIKQKQGDTERRNAEISFQFSASEGKNTCLTNTAYGAFPVIQLKPFSGILIENIALSGSQTCDSLHFDVTEKKSFPHISPSTDFASDDWFEESVDLRRRMVEFYNSSGFSKLSSLSGSSHLSMDLKSLFADISVVLKDTRNRPVQQLTLPDILSILHDITMIEGEAGSGKSALLRKIAILWASGTCPILSRFSLVFYISIPSMEHQQMLSNVISKQLVGSLKEETLKEIVNHFGKQVLFLVDDYGETDAAPQAIDDLVLNNPKNQVSLAVAVRTGLGRKLRKYARNVLTIQEFPLYSSAYVYRQLFSHDIAVVEAFFVDLISSKALQAALKTPLFAFALCAYWVENPTDKLSRDVVICKAYLMHNMLKYPKEPDTVRGLVSSCGELALNGLFQCQFSFADEDLSAAGVNSNNALKFGLLSKLTSQRLHPVYMFIHPSFQEFLAGKRMSELLESTDQLHVELGMSYLQQINTFARVAGRYHYFLKYSCMHSPKATSVIISHLFELLDNSEAYSCNADTKLHLQHHPELSHVEEMLDLLNSNNRQGFLFSFVFCMLLGFAITVAEESNTMTDCAPIILQFLSGKNLSMDLRAPNIELCRFLKQYPEGFSVIKSLEISVSGNKPESDLEFIHSENFASYWDVPNVDQDYSKAFQLVSDVFQNTVSNDYIRRKNLDLFKFGFNLEAPKSLVLMVEASGHIEEWDSIICNLMVFLPLSNHIEIYINKCCGFLASVGMSFELYLSNVVKLTAYKVVLSVEEQELISKMTSLQCLEITDVHPPEHLILHLDRLEGLKELTLNSVCDEWEVINILPDGFKNLKNINKLNLKNVNLTTHSLRLIDFIGHFRDLTSFSLSCNRCPEFEKLINTISQNNKIQKLHLSGMFISNKEFEDLSAVLHSLTHLTVLDIEGNHCADAKVLNVFVQALPSLTQLEELKLPSGPAVKDAATSIIKQFQHLPKLRKVALIDDVLDDSSLVVLAQEAKGGNLRNLEKLDLSLNHDITQSGWKDFFLMAENLVRLNELCITRLYTRQFKTDPVTLIALIQCVSRLHHLNKLIMHGWLLDEKDLEMFNAMKKNHPQSKSFMLLWQWILPFRPTVTE